MIRRIVHTAAWALITLLAIAASAQNSPPAGSSHDGKQWIGTWAAAAQPFMPASLRTFHNQSLRLIVHTSAGGKRVRIRISNTYGDKPLAIGSAHIARRSASADIDPSSDRPVGFSGRPSISVPPGSTVVSDPVELDVPALSDLSISLFLPQVTEARTIHILAQQTNYLSAETGDYTAAVKFPVAKTLHSWPFLTGVDVEASPHTVTIVAFGSSLTDGDGTTLDANRRWPDVLAERLQNARPQKSEVGVLNEGIIGNRLLNDSPQQAGSPFGASLGQAGVTRFERDVLAQPGVRYVIVGLGINDILFPGSLTPASEQMSAESVISGYRQLIERAHKKGLQVIGTTIPPAENAFLTLRNTGPPITFYTPEKESVRQKVNTWMLSSKEFDAVIDFDMVLRDPRHPSQLLPAYDSGDHLHPNDAGCVAEGNAVPLALFASD